MNWMLFKVQLGIVLKEKIIFFYTLMIPIVVAFLNKGMNFHGGAVLYSFWSYIVVTTVLNGFLLNLIDLRESGRLKHLAHQVGSKFDVVVSAFFVQLLVVQLEIFIFNIIVQLFITPVSPYTFIYGFLVSFLATMCCVAMISFLFLLKIRKSHFNWIINILLFSGIILLRVRPRGIWNYFFTILNPFQFIYALYAVPYIINIDSLILGLITLSYLLMGYLILNRISVKSCLR